jgi:hypothetical protein
MKKSIGDRLMKRTLHRLLAVAIIAGACTALPSCGSGGGSDELGGIIETTSYSIPAGETRTVGQDLVVKASQDITIDGILLVKPGVKLALIARRDLTMNGEIKPAPDRAAGASRQGEGGDFVAAAGRTLYINGDHVVGEANITGIEPNMTIEVHGKLRGVRGADAANRNENGKPGGSVEVGTDRANQNVIAYGYDAFTPGTISIIGGQSGEEGIVEGGDGGNGFNDDVGVRQGRDLTLTGTWGGNGGNCALKAGTVDVHLAISVRGGNGGRGGRAGPEAGVRAGDGVRAGEPGGNVAASSGNGGQGGALLLDGTAVGQPASERRPGHGGDAGGITATSGLGGPGEKGGDITFSAGAAGQKGAGFGSEKANDGKAAKVTVNGGGHGGDSDDPNRPGGAGGSMTITGPLGAAPKLDPASKMAAFGFGGDGFNGCYYNPARDGTSGGNGGNITANTALVLEDVVRGGGGGDGLLKAGSGGNRGLFNGAAQGPDGPDGILCPAELQTVTGTGFVAVVLDYDLGAELKAGDTVPLCRIKGGRIGFPEPITPEGGCSNDHLHADGATIVVKVIVDGTRQAVLGPFEDQAPHGCGFGKLTTTPTCEIVTRKPR